MILNDICLGSTGLCITLVYVVMFLNKLPDSIIIFVWNYFNLNGLTTILHGQICNIMT